MVDVNHLSQINLKYGREFGDGVLQALADAMEEGDAVPLPQQRKLFAPWRRVDREGVEAYFHRLQVQQGQCSLSGAAYRRSIRSGQRASHPLCRERPGYGQS